MFTKKKKKSEITFSKMQITAEGDKLKAQQNCFM